METKNWLLLTYKVPAEPAKKRVALWRRLKGMGAVYLQNGVCLLPKTDDHARRLKMIENEISEMAANRSSWKPLLWTRRKKTRW